MSGGDMLAAEFREAMKDKRLLIQRRPDGTHQFYPRPVALGGGQPEWVQASGGGTVVAATLCRVPAAGFPLKPPYVLGIVCLDEGVNILAPLAGNEPPSGGTRVGLKWLDGENGPFLVFSLADEHP